MKRLASLLAAVAATVTLVLPATPAAASREIFCPKGYHKVIRHGQQVCVRNHHHRHHDRDHDRDDR